MKIYIISDLHLEFKKFKIPDDVKADIGIFAGDIGLVNDSYKNFVKEASKKFEKVILIKGNHESYHSSLVESSQKIKEICKDLQNVFFLENEYIDIDNYRICGATLWSKVQENQRNYVLNMMNDYRLIRDLDTDFEHEKSINFIETQIKECTEKNLKMIMVSHHTPSFRATSDPKFDKSNISSAFSTNLEHLIRYPIVLWVYGHTHFSNDQIINGVRLVSNQRGYPGEKILHNPEFVLELIQ